MFSFDEMVLVSGVIGFAATVQGLSGFGFNMLAVPMLVLFFPPQVVVPGVILTYIPLGIAHVWQLRKDVDLRLWAMMIGSAALAVPFGALVLRDTDTVTMKRGIGAVLLVLTLLLQLRPGAPFVRDRLARFGGGFVSGFLAASTGVSGPPLVLLGLKQQWPFQAFRATLLAYFLSISIVCLPFQWRLNLVNEGTVFFAGAGIPGIIFGFLVSSWLRKWVDGKRFRWVAIVLVLCGGLAALVF